MFSKLAGFFTRKPPQIDTPYGPVSEAARKQAAANMKLDPKLRDRVVEAVSRDVGSPEAGLAEAKRRYPEAWGK
jgi:hypothetical protein